MTQIEDIESQLAKLHEEEISEVNEEINESEMVEIHIESEGPEDPNSFHGFEVDVQTEETVDAGAVDNSDDSDYEPPEKMKHIEDEQNDMDMDNTSALLEAAALAEQNLTTNSE